MAALLKRKEEIEKKKRGNFYDFRAYIDNLCRKWAEERKRVAQMELMAYKQQQKGFENIKYTPCDLKML